MRNTDRDQESIFQISALVLGFVLLLPSGPATASCSDLIFLDTFETGDTSRWGNSPDPALATGTWSFTLDFTGSSRAFALELIQRSDGSVTGYLLGGTRERVLVAGSVSGTTVTLELELAYPAATRMITISGTLGRETIIATASGDLTPQAVTLNRTGCELFEQQLVAAVDTGGPEPEHVRLLSVVLDGDGGFVAGGFVGQDDCDLWACDGGVTSFSEVGDVLTAGLETDGGCSAGSSFTVTWNPGGIYTGTYSFTDCSGTTSGDLLAATAMGTSSSEVREVLGTRLAIADALESGVPLTAPIEAVSSTYLNFGKDEPALRAELNAEMALYTAIDVDLERTREIFTRTHPRALPDLIEPLGLKLDERRTGVPTVGGGDQVTFRDTNARPIIDDFALSALEPGGWKIAGNQTAALDLPIASTVAPGGARLEAPTAAGLPVYVSIGPYGGHFGPLTGHPSGDAKANFAGFMAEDDGDMEELVGDGDGIREPGEVWGFPVGGDPTGNAVRLRRPAFIAPADGAVWTVIFAEGSSSIHFENEPHWKIDLELPGQVRYAFGHLGRIAPALRALVLAATGIDPDTFTGPAGTDLLAGYDPIPVVAGTELALPQILADPVPGHPGYWVGGGSFLEWP